MRYLLSLVIVILFCVPASAQTKKNKKDKDQSNSVKSGSIKITTSDGRTLDYGGYEVSHENDRKTFEKDLKKKEKEALAIQTKFIDIALTQPPITGPVLVRERPFYPPIIVVAPCPLPCAEPCERIPCRRAPCVRRPCRRTGQPLCSCSGHLARVGGNPDAGCTCTYGSPCMPNEGAGR